MSGERSKSTRLIVVGPMLGHYPGHVPFVGEALAARLAASGYQVTCTSGQRNRGLRLVDMAATLIRNANRADVQILQIYGGLSFVAEDMSSQLGRVIGQKIIMHLHGGDMPAFVSRHPVWSRRVLRRAAAIVAPSLFLQRAVTSLGVTVNIIPNAVDVAAYPYRWRNVVGPRLFWMRTFHSIYNPEMALRAFARVRLVEPEATLVMAGQDKGTELQVRRLAHELNLVDAVRFAGFLTQESKIREASAADIFLNTNHIDNTPVSVIEACAMGLPVVATNVGGISDLLTDTETALLVPDNDDQGMAESILKLIHEPELAGRLSAGGRRMAERLSWDATQRQWEELIEAVMRTPHHERARRVA